jgi:hypothetical protein
MVEQVDRHEENRQREYKNKDCCRYVEHPSARFTVTAWDTLFELQIIVLFALPTEGGLIVTHS